MVDTLSMFVLPRDVVVEGPGGRPAVLSGSGSGCGGCHGLVEARVAIVQGDGNLRNLEVSRAAATVGTVVFATAKYDCTSQGIFFHEDCDLREVWEVVGSGSGKRYVHEERPSPGGFDSLKFGASKTGTLTFRMPAESVEVMFSLKQPTFAGPVLTGDHIVGNGSASVALASATEVADIEKERQDKKLEEAFGSFLGQVGPWLPWAALVGVAVVGVAVAAPAVSKYIEENT